MNITGQSIFEEIKGLQEEIRDFDKAVEALEDSGVVLGSAAYKKVKELRNDSQNALNVALRANYQVPSKLKKNKSPVDPFEPQDDDF